MALPPASQSQQLLEEHVKDEYQLHHSKMVAEVMRALCAWVAEMRPETATDEILNPDLWYQTGLLHDVDYYEFPEEHPQKSLVWLRDLGYPEEMIHAIDAHYVGKGPSPENLLDAALIACDELSGLIYAYSLMRPERYVGMEVKGVVKRLKDKAFAAKINRDDISFGIEHLEKLSDGKVTREKLIEIMIETFSKL